MKVAYNDEYGGFCLSLEGLDLLARKKGVSITWYERVYDFDYEYKRVVSFLDIKEKNFLALTKDMGEKIGDINNNIVFSPHIDEHKDRIDGDLISVIEELGSKAAASFSSLAVIEIPDHCCLKIQDDDGKEVVSWCEVNNCHQHMQDIENNKLQAKAVHDFVDSMIGAFESGFLESNTLTLAEIHRMAQNYVLDTYSVVTPLLVDEWGEDLAKSAGLNSISKNKKLTSMVDMPLTE
ncbi:MAG: hypothetical protein QM504_08150 [Pseudomonadota bacterium]